LDAGLGLRHRDDVVNADRPAIVEVPPDELAPELAGDDQSAHRGARTQEQEGGLCERQARGDFVEAAEFRQPIANGPLADLRLQKRLRIATAAADSAPAPCEVDQPLRFPLRETARAITDVKDLHRSPRPSLLRTVV